MKARALIFGTAVALVASLSAAQQNVKQHLLTATIGTNATYTVTNDTSIVSGWIHEIKVDHTGTDTGICTVVAVPIGVASTTFGNVTLAYSTNVTGETIFRPRFDATDYLGTALTNDPPGMYMCAGDTIRFTVIGGVTGNVYKTLVKYINTK